MVVRALVFAIGTVTRIFLFAAHLPVRYGRRGHLPVAVIAIVRGKRYYLPFAANANVVCLTSPTCLPRHSPQGDGGSDLSDLSDEAPSTRSAARVGVSPFHQSSFIIHQSPPRRRASRVFHSQKAAADLKPSWAAISFWGILCSAAATKPRRTQLTYSPIVIPYSALKSRIR